MIQLFIFSCCNEKLFYFTMLCLLEVFFVQLFKSSYWICYTFIESHEWRINIVGRTPGSCGLILHVLYRKVEGSNLTGAKNLFQFKSTKYLFREVRAEEKGNRAAANFLLMLAIYRRAFFWPPSMVNISVTITGKKIISRAF